MKQRLLLFIFQAIGKSAIVFVRIILGKLRIDRFAGSQQEIYIRYEFGFVFDSVIFKARSKFLIRLILWKVVDDGFTGPRRKIDGRYEFRLKVILQGLRGK